MRILITGGAGFIGSNVVDFYCKDEKNKVFVIDNLSRDPNHSNLNRILKYPNLHFQEQDMRNLHFIQDFFKKYQFDFIIHCAGQTAVTTSIVDSYMDFQTNVVGSVNLLETIRQSGQEPAIILCSTNKVYGENINDLNVIEKDYRYEYPNKIMSIWESYPIDNTLHSPYGCSKLCADLYFQEYGKTYGLKTGIFRMSCIYGLYQIGTENQGWVSHFILTALKKQPIIIYGSGKQTRDLLYIDDLIQAFQCFYNRSSGLKGEVFNIGGGRDNTISLLELIAILETELVVKVKVNYDKERVGDQKVYVSDIKKARDVLDWSPAIDKFTGLYQTIQFYKQQVKEGKNNG